MLLLTRKKGDSIIINKIITVKVIRIKSHQVILGINAPSYIPVNREEVEMEIEGSITQEENKDD